MSANEPVGLIRDDDACIMFNYRADRAREITMALMDSSLEQPSRSLVPKNLTYTIMTQYDKTFSLPFVLPPEHPDNILADVMSAAELEESARRRDRKVCACHILLQRRKRKAVHRRRARAGCRRPKSPPTI